MNSSERVQVGELWVRVSKMYAREIPRESLTMMLDAVSDIDGDKLIGALNEWVRTSKFPRHPTPAEVRNLAMPSIDDDTQAREVASRITYALRKFGYTNPVRAQEYIGPVGWHVVGRCGGWQNVCENTMEDQMGVFTAQARDLAKASIEISRSGLFDQPVAFPIMKEMPKLESDNDRVKRIDTERYRQLNEMTNRLAEAKKLGE